MDRPVHVIGGGISGLVAAITAAEAGAPVVLHEAADALGGRALGGTGWPGVNLGPHVVFTDGALCRWLRSHDIPVALRRPSVRPPRLLDDGGSHVPVRESIRLAATLPAQPAPVDESFQAWSERVFGSARSALLCRLAGLFTFHHDPGSLSARFVWDRYRRTLLRPDRVRSVVGGWSALVDALADRAAALGVSIAVGDKVTPVGLPDGPTIVATKLATAARLLERPLSWPGSRTALLDVVATPGPGRAWPTLLADVRSDLHTCCMVERTAVLAPTLSGVGGGELFQAQLGIGAGVMVATGIDRIEDALDRAVKGWRERVVWRRGQVVVNSSGAVDLPGATWRDRPGVDQGDDRFLAGDAVAAPGLLSEVAVNSGVQAARLAVDARRRRAFAVGWSGPSLTPERRFAVLAAALPGAALDTFETSPGNGDHEPWEIEPVDETGPGYRLATAPGGIVRGTAVTTTSTGRRVTTLGWSRWRAPAQGLVSRLVAGRRPASRRLRRLGR